MAPKQARVKQTNERLCWKIVGELKELGMVRKGWVNGSKERSWETTVGKGQDWGGNGSINRFSKEEV